MIRAFTTRASLWLCLALGCSGGGSTPDASPPAPDAAPSDAGTPADASDAAPPPPDVAPPRCEPPATLPSTCNGHEALCDRRFDQVAYATTHNAMSNRQERWLAPNQNLPIPRQLEDGVRGLMLDAHYDEGEVLLCHGICSAGSEPLVDGLAKITEFLRCHPAEVVTLIFESYISAEDTRQAFEDSGLIDNVYVHDSVEWPTLREMIDAGERVVVLTDSDGGTYDWYLDVWDLAFETHFSAESRDDFSCADNRGDPGNDLFILNHFLTKPLPAESLAEMVNFNPYFGERAAECQTFQDHIPNFVTVDFYDIGDTLAVTDGLNGVP